MASSTGEEGARDAEIRLWRDGDWWLAEDLETGVTTQGQSREAALENLDDAVAVREGTAGEEPTGDQLRAAGVEPGDNTTGEQEPPDVLD